MGLRPPARLLLVCLTTRSKALISCPRWPKSMISGRGASKWGGSVMSVRCRIFPIQQHRLCCGVLPRRVLASGPPSPVRRFADGAVFAGSSRSCTGSGSAMTPGTQRALDGVRVNIRSGPQRDGDGLLTAATPSSNCTLPPYCWNIPLHIHNNTYAFVSPEGGPLPARAGCRRCNHSSLSQCCRVRTAKTRRSTSRRAHQPTPRGSQFPLFHMWACFCDLFFFFLHQKSSPLRSRGRMVYCREEQPMEPSHGTGVGSGIQNQVLRME